MDRGGRSGLPNDTVADLIIIGIVASIDLKFNARVVRLIDEPPEIAEFDSDVPPTQTVSMDTRFFRRIT